jgi:tetratricopeptide (TPR) repeat protein
MARALHSAVVGILLAGAPLAVVAQQGAKEYPDCTRQPSDSDTSAAKGAFQAGQVSFNEADYDRAINYWEDAYRRDCTAHAMLLNLARAYELNGNPRQAVIALDTYLARNPSSPQRDQIGRRVEVLKEKIAALPTATETSTPTETDEPTNTAVPATTATGIPTDQRTAGSRPILPLVVAGAGGAIAIVGAIVYLGATSDYNKAKDDCGGKVTGCTAEVEQRGNDAADRQTLGGVVTGAGLAVAAGGLVWYFLSASEGGAEAGALSKPERAKLSPSITPGYAGVTFAGSF